MSMMKLSATFERVGVREIGLKSSLMLQIEDALGRGQTLASFHASGTLHSKNEVFRISAIGAARIYAKFLSTQLGRLSGPLAREAFSSKSFLATECSVTDIGRSSAISKFSIYSPCQAIFFFRWLLLACVVPMSRFQPRPV